MTDKKKLKTKLKQADVKGKGDILLSGQGKHICSQLYAKNIDI